VGYYTQEGTKMKRALPLLLILVFLVINGSSVSALTTGTNPPLDPSVPEGSVIDFTLIITDIHGTSLQIITDLEQDGTTPIFDTSNLGQYEVSLRGNTLEIKLKTGQSWPNSLEIHIHGKIPQGIQVKTIMTPSNKRLQLKFFDLGEHIYYRVTDGVDSESKNFVIIHPQLERVNNIIQNNITDENAKRIAEEYIELGLIDYVENDLIPLFVKYDAQTWQQMSDKINKLEALVSELNQTLKELNQTVKSQEATIQKQRQEISSLSAKVTELNQTNAQLKEELEKTMTERTNYKKKSSTMTIVSGVLLIIAIIAGVGGYSSGKKSGYQEGYKRGRSTGREEGWREGYDAGYNAGLEACKNTSI
jgi:uncharacterized coiled-coil protein SlyX